MHAQETFTAAGWRYLDELHGRYDAVTAEVRTLEARLDTCEPAVRFLIENDLRNARARKAKAWQAYSAERFQ